MTKFAIFDCNAGLLQWTGEGETARDVLIQFDKAVGINPHGLSMDAVAAEFVAYEVSDAEAVELQAWDGSSITWPLAGHSPLPA
jgi:hypothetical protein